jgi:hypothetical protein
MSSVTDLFIVKLGHWSAECFSNADAVVRLGKGQATTPAQINAIFDCAPPHFSTTSPVGFVACIGQPQGCRLLNRVDVEITVAFD